MEKSWKMFFELHAHYPKNFALCAIFPKSDNEIGVVSFFFCSEGVAKGGDVEATVRKGKVLSH